MNFHIITLFPGAFDSYLNESILSRAIEDKKIKVSFYNPRDFSDNKFKHIDQKPYSGGPGMVIQALPVIKAIEKALKSIVISHKSLVKRNKKTKILMTHDSVLKTTKIIFFSPGGKQFDTGLAKKTASKYTDIIFVCGRYEGIDARVKKVFKMEEVSVGPFVLTGGELPAMVVMDCVARQVKGVLGNFYSLEESRVSSHDVYTRPEVFEYLSHFDKNGRPISKADLGKGKKYRVPKVLLSGDHKKIEAWKMKR